ncbi:unnamed protein product [Parnassius apollo]|uniref:(apollo) hypothetical protein n=1 Tax=Parnassius apollo TaxID=110799 RepID=A0A8S3Y8N5_PARAO|nr:unnamed protein product [Parnassius apollo]
MVYKQLFRLWMCILVQFVFVIPRQQMFPTESGSRLLRGELKYDSNCGFSKMQTWFLFMVLLLAGAHGGGVTKTDEDGISQPWSENFKELENLYGKTSDKDLYGAKLPPSVRFDAAKIKLKGKASELAQARPTYAYNHNYDDVFNSQFKKLENPEHSTNYISYSNFPTNNQPTSPTEVSNTYNYVKHLGQTDKQNTEYPTQESGGFKPYFSYVGRNPEGSDMRFYTSETNKVRESGSKEKFGENRIRVTNKDRSKVRQFKGNALISHTKCRAGVCRKKITDSHRFHTKPTVKKIKKIVYTY